MTKEDIYRVQQLLNDKGANLTVDGVFGAKTREAIIQWQLQNNLLPDGIINNTLISALSSNAVTTSKESFITKTIDFIKVKKTPIIILGSIGIFGYGVYFLRKKFKK